MKRQASIGMYYLYTILVATLLIAFISSCGTSNGCGYAKAQKYNAKQMRKSHRYNSRQ